MTPVIPKDEVQESQKSQTGHNDGGQQKDQDFEFEQPEKRIESQQSEKKSHRRNSSKKIGSHRSKISDKGNDPTADADANGGDNLQ